MRKIRAENAWFEIEKRRSWLKPRHKALLLTLGISLVILNGLQNFLMEHTISFFASLHYMKSSNIITEQLYGRVLEVVPLNVISIIGFEVVLSFVMIWVTADYLEQWFAKREDRRLFER